MRKLFMLAVIGAAILFPTASHAQFQLGVRLGYGGASGDAFKDKGDGTNAKMSDGIKSQVPVQLDAMYALTPELRLGAYASYGFAQTGGNLKDVCDTSGVDCSTSEWRLGIQGTYAFTMVSPKFVPWAGLGIGYEWSSYTAEGGGAKVETKLNGFEFATLQVGGDYKVNPLFSFGPYLTYSFAQYSGGEQTATIPGLGTQTVKFSDFADKTMHSWWSIGVAGKFDFGK